LNERYTIARRLGGGGQATAYLARDLQNNSCDVVLKETILPVYADLHTRKQALEKFHEEAFALEKVKHPQIVKYLDSFVEDHRAYLVLHFIDGTTLRKTIEEHGPLAEDKALDYSKQMCEILRALHGLNPPLVHRDFTPDNMMVNKEGKLVLIDFAVAVQSQDSSSESAGKIAYMAPEQFKGSSSPQTDIYSFGCTMHYILTGEDPVPLTESHPGGKLGAVVAKATSQSANERYGSIRELDIALP
jgi:serine/threonine-protein kinase